MSANVGNAGSAELESVLSGQNGGMQQDQRLAEIVEENDDDRMALRQATVIHTSDLASIAASLSSGNILSSSDSGGGGGGGGGGHKGSSNTTSSSSITSTTSSSSTSSAGLSGHGSSDAAMMASRMMNGGSLHKSKSGSSSRSKGGSMGSSMSSRNSRGGRGGSSAMPPRVDAFSLFSPPPAPSSSSHHPGVSDLFGSLEPQPIVQRRMSASLPSDDGGIGTGIEGGLSNLTLGIVVGEMHEQGKRQTMEDESVLLMSTGGSSPAGGSSNAYFGVYDGHGGGKTSKYLKDVLHRYILEDPAYPTNMQQAIIEGCRSCDERCGYTSGSTAVFCVVESNLLWFANVGDSEAVLSVAGRAVAMSNPHRPEGSEKLRIEKAGGFVLRKRIMGLLAVSRSFGDVDSKPTHPLSTLGTYGGTYTGDFVISTFDFY